jgi:GT2 family glycosyltransferase/glycosyltransferase involved in cell wall biosynthesis
MKLSILIPAFNQVAFTTRCLDALESDLDHHSEVVLIDDGSTDSTPALAERRSLRYLRLSGRQGFAAAINHGAAAARGEALLLLNNDTIPQSGWLPAMRAALDEPTVGVVGARLIYPGTNLIQHAGMALGAGGIPYHVHRYTDAGAPHVTRRRPFACVTGACLLVRRHLFETLGGLDERFRNGCEDVDLCLAVGERGYLCLYEPEAVVLHYEGVSEGRFDHAGANLERLREKWGERMPQHDDGLLVEERCEPPVSGRRQPPAAAADDARSGVAVAEPRTLTAERPERAATAPSVAPPLCWIGDFYDDSRAAAHQRALCLTLDRLGVRVRPVSDAGARPDWCGEDAVTLRRLHGLAATALDAGYVAVSTRLGATGATAASEWQQAGRRCLRPAALDETAVAALVARPAVEQIWLAGESQRTLLVEQGVEAASLRVVPPGVDTRRIDPDRAPLFIEGAHGFVFLGVLPWHRDRGWDVLLRAYLREFRPGEDVTLIIYAAGEGLAIGPGRLARELDRELPELGEQGDSPDVVILNEPLNAEDYAGLLTAADVLVTPDRIATGGRVQLEALAAGLPVITTGHGVAAELVDDEVGALIPLAAPATGVTVEPSVEGLQELMRAATAAPAWVNDRRRGARARVEQSWTIEHEARALIAALEELARGRAGSS